MPEGSGEGPRVLPQGMVDPTPKTLEFPPPLAEEIQPTRRELVPFIPHRKLYLRPDLPHHGQLHGEETMMLTQVILNQAYQDVLLRRGEAAADEFIGRVDRASLLHAAAYHDCARMSDWPVWGNSFDAWPDNPFMKLDYGPRGFTPWESENRKHGPRGAKLITEPRQIREIDPDLTPEQIKMIRFIIHNHTPSVIDAASKAMEKRGFEKGRRHIEDYEDPMKLMLRLMQEADALAKERLWFSHPTYGETLDPKIAEIREKKRNDPSEKSLGSLTFPGTVSLVPLTRAHAWMNRLDPQVNGLYPGPDRSGIALDSGQRLGILKP